MPPSIASPSCPSSFLHPPRPPLPTQAALRSQEWSGEMRCGISVVFFFFFFLLACAIENTARQGPCQQIGEMQMGGEKAPRWHLDPVQMWLQPPGWSQHWQSASIDGWTKQGTGCENGWGQSGNLTQTKKMKDGEELPTKAFRQYKSQSNLLTANWAQECVHQYKLPLTTGWLLRGLTEPLDLMQSFHDCLFFKGNTYMMCLCTYVL